jgi:hypothetical protein
LCTDLPYIEIPAAKQGGARCDESTARVQVAYFLTYGTLLGAVREGDGPSPLAAVKRHDRFPQ